MTSSPGTTDDSGRVLYRGYEIKVEGQAFDGTPAVIIFCRGEMIDTLPNAQLHHATAIIDGWHNAP